MQYRTSKMGESATRGRFLLTVLSAVLVFVVGGIVYFKLFSPGLEHSPESAPDGTIAYQSAGYHEEEIPKIRETIRRLLNSHTKRL